MIVKVPAMREQLQPCLQTLILNMSRQVLQWQGMSHMPVHAWHKCLFGLQNKTETVPCGGIKELSSLDDHQVGGRVDAPGKGGGRDQDLNLATHKQRLHSLTI